MQQHIQSLAKPGKWGTHVELVAAATYFQIPLFIVRTPSTTHEWEVFHPLGQASQFKYQLCPEIDPSDEGLNVPDHFELLYRNNCHHDSITTLTGELSTDKPSLICDCRDTVIN